MNVGDLVMTRKGNMALITAKESCSIYVDLLYCGTGHHRTGFHISGIARVIKK